mmetsp:Transcript_53740/g.151382  ORF Transcript_53740/g.151382 Transcript_53740/m.151382 type:complete len:102 (-) Transcript_53740:23-328(-)
MSCGLPVLVTGTLLLVWFSHYAGNGGGKSGVVMEPANDSHACPDGDDAARGSASEAPCDGSRGGGVSLVQRTLHVAARQASQSGIYSAPPSAAGGRRPGVQ